jgi:hypothetical protein
VVKGGSNKVTVETGKVGAPVEAPILTVFGCEILVYFSYSIVCWFNVGGEKVIICCKVGNEVSLGIDILLLVDDSIADFWVPMVGSAEHTKKIQIIIDMI